MNEEEEFEFRARAEAEEAESSAPTESAGDGIGSKITGALGTALGVVASAADRLGPAEIRGAAEGIQNYEPEGNGSFHPGVLVAAAKGAWNGLINPADVQTAETQYARSGLSTEQKSADVLTPGFVMRSHAATGAYGLKPEDAAKYADDQMYPLNVHYASMAQVAGSIQDAISPTLPVGRLAGLGSKTGKVSADVLKKGATKAILSNYSPKQLSEYAQKLGVFGQETDAVTAVAEKLKENDLLYAPGKANLNLKRAKHDIGTQINKTVADAKNADIMVNPQGVINRYSELKATALDATGEGVGDFRDLQNNVFPELQAMIDDLKPNELGQVSIDKGVNFRRALQGLVKKWTNTPNGPVVQKVAKDMQASMNEEILKSDKVFGPKLAALNHKFSELSDAGDLIEGAYDKSLGNTLAGKEGTILKRVAELVKHPIDASSAPIHALMKLNPKLAEKLANLGNIPVGVQESGKQTMSTITHEELEALKAQFVKGGKAGDLDPRSAGGRFNLDPQHEFVKREGLETPEINPRSPGRAPLGEDPGHVFDIHPKHDGPHPRNPGRHPLGEDNKHTFDIHPKHDGPRPRSPKRYPLN